VLVEQVMINLVDNAIRYTPAETPLDISATATGEEMTIEVADRGPGILPGEEERIFEKFYRARPGGADGGAGLGLTICSAVVRAHGGRIWACNRAGGGAAFRFTLPLAGEVPGSREALPEIVGSFERGRVEDT
jgi:two-component system sensor histidine kinase KdpD